MGVHSTMNMNSAAQWTWKCWYYSRVGLGSGSENGVWMYMYTGHVTLSLCLQASTARTASIAPASSSSLISSRSSTGRQYYPIMLTYRNHIKAFFCTGNLVSKLCFKSAGIPFCSQHVRVYVLVMNRLKIRSNDVLVCCFVAGWMLLLENSVMWVC